MGLINWVKLQLDKATVALVVAGAFAVAMVVVAVGEAFGAVTGDVSMIYNLGYLGLGYIFGEQIAKRSS